MEQNENDRQQFGGSKGPRVWSGIIILIAGILLLCYKMGAPIPGWFFTWPVLLIAIGILTGIKSRFHNPGAFVMIIVGTVFLIDQTSPELNFHNYIVPAILISVGIIYILRPGHTWSGRTRRERRWMNYDKQYPVTGTSGNYAETQSNTKDENAEYVEINAAFGSVKKIILSKNFRGGEMNCFMGGAEINLMQADLQRPAKLEVNAVFGGAKLLVPSNWDVKNEVTAVFGGIEDKRNITNTVRDPEKIVILHGTCVFGGIEITNY